MDTQLLVTELGQQRIILGFPWLKEHNLDINWQTGEFKWWTLWPLKVKRFHNGPMQHTKELTELKLDKIEQPIWSIKMDNNLEVKLHLDKAHLPTQGSPDAAGYDLYSAEDKTVPTQGKYLSTLRSWLLPRQEPMDKSPLKVDWLPNIWSQQEQELSMQIAEEQYLCYYSIIQTRTSE